MAISFDTFWSPSAPVIGINSANSFSISSSGLILRRTYWRFRLPVCPFIHRECFGGRPRPTDSSSETSAMGRRRHGLALVIGFAAQVHGLAAGQALPPFNGGVGIKFGKFDSLTPPTSSLGG